jgi:hypothetical protein
MGFGGPAGFWPDKDAQHRSTMRTSERHLAKSVGIAQVASTRD